MGEGESLSSPCVQLHPLRPERVLPMRREAQSSHIACESHQANGQTPNHKNQVPQTPSLLFAAPRYSWERTKKSKRKYCHSCSLGMDKPTTPLQGQLESSQGSHPHFLPQIPPGDTSMGTTPQRMCYQHHPCLFASPFSKTDRLLSKSVHWVLTSFPGAD